jgi:hypothetical protein
LERLRPRRDHRQDDDDDDDDGGPPEELLSKLLGGCTAELSSYIKYSIRPALYAHIATLAEEWEDYETLRRVGEQLALESRLLSPTKPKEALAVGARYQIRAMKSSGLDKKALALERKYRVFLKTPKAGWEEESLEVGNISTSWDESIRNEWHYALDQ